MSFGNPYAATRSFINDPGGAQEYANQYQNWEQQHGPLAQLQTAQDAANKANEKRYKKILSMYEGLGTTGRASQEEARKISEKQYQELLGTFSTLGQAGRTRIQQQTAQQQAASTQSLTSRGLGSTTISGAMSRGIAGEGELQRQQLEEGITQQKAGVMGQRQAVTAEEQRSREQFEQWLASSKAGVMERKTEAGPDLSMYAQLMQSASRGPQRTFVQGSGRSWAWGEPGSTTNPYR
jgi:hypothetical protein